MIDNRKGIEEAHGLKDKLVLVLEGRPTPEVMLALTLTVTEAIVNGYDPDEWLHMLGLLCTQAVKSMAQGPQNWETRDGMPLVRVLQ
jgi:hypothetical protein